MPALRLSGLASGVDSDSLISQLIALEKQGQNKFTLGQSRVGARQSGLKDVASRLTNLKNAAAELRSVTTWKDKQSVTSSDTTRLDVSSTTTAGPGGYSLEIQRMARSEQRTYDFTPSSSAGQITIGGVAVDLAADATIADAVSAINTATGSPVYAAAVEGRLVLSARTTGAASAFTASGSTVAEDATKARAGLDALYTIDGGAQQSSATNTVEGAIAGVKLTFKGTTNGSVTVNVGAPGVDKDALVAKMKTFVENYNSAITFMREKVTEKSDPKATTSSGVRAGALRGDALLQSTTGALRGLASEPVAGLPAELDQLSELGLTTGATTGSGTVSQDALAGKLSFDETKFRALLDTNPDGVKKLLGAVTGTSGFAQKIEGALEPLTGATGTISERVKAADGEISRLKDQITRSDARIAGKEKRLRAQFLAMEQAMAASNASSAQLSAALTRNFSQ